MEDKSRINKIKSVRDLEVYQKAFDAAMQVRKHPKHKHGYNLPLDVITLMKRHS
jgi:hypothetical protein